MCQYPSETIMRSLPTLSRRQLATLCAVAGLPQPGAQAQTAPAVEPLRSVFLMDLIAETAAAIPAGSRNVVPVLNGAFEGPRLKGTITGPGGDWTMRRPDGVTILDVRLILQTDDNQRIYVTYRGVVYRPAQQPAAGGGPAASAAPTYFRITPVFETTSSKYDWLNRRSRKGRLSHLRDSLTAARIGAPWFREQNLVYRDTIKATAYFSGAWNFRHGREHDPRFRMEKVPGNVKGTLTATAL
jgi:hypothetical protein